jgi:hypothetical protein
VHAVDAQMRLTSWGDATLCCNLREIIDHIDELRFRSQNEKHELSHLYEAKIKNMGNAGRNGGSTRVCTSAWP